MNGSDKEESAHLNEAIFSQIRECGDIISSILLIYKFITENDIAVDFNLDKLRLIALRSVENDTSTYLWHINALIAASADFEHLLLGIEMMFSRFLANKDVFIREKQKEKESKSLALINKNKNKNISNKYIVESYYDYGANNEYSMLKTPRKQPPSINIVTNNENQNTQNNEDKEYMNKYRGKISSPISFRMRQQKRLNQSERRSNSPKENSDFINAIDHLQKMPSYEPQIASPFNVSKFANRVDMTTKEME